MPTYLYRCEKGCQEERMLRLSQHRDVQCCLTHWMPMDQIITAPILVKASADVCYDSPIDGSHITSWDKRTEDLKRNNCTPYDPGQRTDYHTRLKESEAALDKTIDIAVESAIEKMPTAKRGKLYSELTEQGVTADVSRS